jgi:hypothetical protein
MEARRPASKAELMSEWDIPFTDETIVKFNRVWDKHMKQKLKGGQALEEVIDGVAAWMRETMLRRGPNTDSGGGPCLTMPKANIVQEFCRNGDKWGRGLNVRARKDNTAII